MTPDPTLQQRYADILAEPANADLAVMVQALEAHFTASALPASLSQAPLPVAQATPGAVPTTLPTMKGSIPLENHLTTLEPRRRIGQATPPSENRARRRSYPLIAAFVLVLMIGAFFGFRFLRQQPGVGAPGVTTTPTKTTTSAHYLRLDAYKPTIIRAGAQTPITGYSVGSGDNVMIFQVNLDPNQTKPGDVVTAVWEVAGTPLGGSQCCRHQIVAHDPQADDFTFTAVLTNPGTGSAKIYYNGTLAYTATFTIAAYSFPEIGPSTPTK